MIKHLFFLILSSFTVALQGQQIGFDKLTYMPSSVRLSDVARCSNGDFVTIYSSSSTMNNSFPVVRYDSSGNLLWHKEFMNQNLDYASGIDVIEAMNGDILISTSGLNTNNVSMIGVLRINSQGTLLWERAYSSGGSPGFNLSGTSILLETDDGSIYLGASDKLFPSSEATIIFRFTAAGSLLWSKTFGTSPWQSIRALYKAPSSGVYLCAQNNPGNTFQIFTIDSAGTLSNSIQYPQWGFFDDLVIDQNYAIKAILTHNSSSAIRLIELDSLGNISNARWSAFSTNSFGNTLFSFGGGYVSTHAASSLGTRLCNWSASSSQINGINYFDSTLFQTLGAFQATDGSIYLVGDHEPLDSVSRIIRTGSMSGNNFQLGACSQVASNFIFTPLSLGSTVSLTVSLSVYVPVSQASSISSVNIQVSVVDNCQSQVSVSEISESSFDLFPNPVSDVVFVSGDFTGENLVEIFSLTGEIVMRTSLPAEGNRIGILTDQLSEGVYIIRILDSEKNALTKRFVVSR
jgi:Secretion system C-terminal sorting domain